MNFANFSYTERSINYPNAEIGVPRPSPRREAAPPTISASATPRTTWTEVLESPTPTSYGEVLSLSPPVARNMPNAASEIVRPSFNTSIIIIYLSRGLAMEGGGACTPRRSPPRPPHTHRARGANHRRFPRVSQIGAIGAIGRSARSDDRTKATGRTANRGWTWPMGLGQRGQSGQFRQRSPSAQDRP